MNNKITKERIIVIVAFALGMFTMFLFEEKRIGITKEHNSSLMQTTIELDQQDTNLIIADNDLIPLLIACEPPSLTTCNAPETQRKTLARYRIWQKLDDYRHKTIDPQLNMLMGK